MKVVIIGYFPEAARKNILTSFPADWVIRIVTPTEAEKEIIDADVLIPEHLKINAELIAKAPKLKLVQTGAGFDNVNLEDCTKFGVQACNAAGVNANAVAEHVMAFILSWYKNIPYLNSFIKAHKDEKDLLYTGSELSEKTVGIVGLGHVGRLVAEYCSAFHMRVLGYNHRPVSLPGVEQVDLDTLFRESDIISLHIPLKADTRRMVNAEVLAKMKKDAVLVNTSRGGIIDESALICALQNGEIGGACLDVYETEPIPQDNPLRELDNVILTPHTAGLPDGLKYHKKRYAFFVSNIRKVMNNELPDCRLNSI